MANWAWPHTPASNMARLLIADGPSAGAEIGFLPPDTAAPAQVAWTGWFLGGFRAYLYEWTGETVMDRGRTSALVYRFTGRWLDADEVPPVMVEMAELWADGAEMIRNAFDVPVEVIFPGV